jgi:hypothetical protein
MSTLCNHQNQIRDVAPRTPAGCEECLKSGDRWVHLRLCLTCGHVGCCDASPNRHATLHFHSTRHPIVEPFLSTERWRWCYVDQVVVDPPARATIGAQEAPEGRADPVGGSPPAQQRPGGLLSRLIGSLHRHNYLVGVIDDPGSAARGAHALEIYGFAADDIVLQAGSQIAERLRHPDFEDLVREATREEGSICRQYDELARGGAVLTVHTPTPDDVRRACHILTAYGAHSLLHFGDWEISEVPAGERCWS